MVDVRTAVVEVAQVCSDDEFDCQDSHQTCLTREQLCDGTSDCEGGEDELNCGIVYKHKIYSKMLY